MPVRRGGAKKGAKKTAAQRRAESGEEPEQLVEVEVMDPEDVAAQEVGAIADDGSGNAVVPIPATVKQQLSAAERKRQAVQLKLMGASYQAIADRLGYADASGAYRAVQSGMKEALLDSATDLRNATFMQLQTLFMVNWPKALKGDERATVLVLQVQDRIRSLMGLDGLPVGEEIQVEGVLVVGGDKDNYIEAMRKLRKQSSQEGG